MASSPPPVSLHPASPADIPHLAAISSQAFKSDTHTQLKESIKGTDHAAEMAPVLESWMSTSSRRCSVIKAVNGEGAIVGWVSWGFRGVDGPPFEVTEEGGRVVGGVGDEAEVASKRNEGGTPEQKAKIAELEEITTASMVHWQAKLMPGGCKCMYIIAVSVLPSYQGMGVGRALIRWGTRLADEKGVICWVHSSDRGWRVFEKEGFGEVGRLSVELDEYAGGVRSDGSEGGGGNGKWGRYVWRYMVRPARPLSEN
jgi:predicted N-acetyltransferase YhbS